MKLRHMVFAFPLVLAGCSSGDFQTAAPNDDAQGPDDTSVGDSSVTIDSAPPPDVAGETDDSSPGDATSFETGVDCTSATDGTVCGSGTGRFICLDKACVQSICGDGFTDTGHDEECDNGAANGAGTGCEVTCKFSCHATSDCTAANPCVSGITCGATHKCSGGTNAPDGNACTKPGVSGTGNCKGGACVLNCTKDAECDDKNVCNGTETCDLSTHKCELGTALACTQSSCGASQCSPTSGCPSPNACGGFCALANAPNTPCAATCSQSGKWQCATKDTVNCVDTITSGHPGDACGTNLCGTLSCNSAGSALTCPNDHTLNACGGCGTLAHDKGSPCGGQCGTATYQCSPSDKNSVLCVDPLASPSHPVVGSSCGCASFACNAGNTDIVCTVSPSNPAGLCPTTLPASCDAPVCNVTSTTTSTCGTTRKDSLCVLSNNPCMVATCVDSNCVPDSTSGQPVVVCGQAENNASLSPVVGCKLTLANDSDGDGYSSDTSCPISLNLSPDCDDVVASVFPGQTAYFSTAITAGPKAGTFDYNCSATSLSSGEEKEFAQATCTVSGTGCKQSGLYLGASPACGVAGDTAICTRIGSSCTAVGDDGSLVQQCH